MFQNKLSYIIYITSCYRKLTPSACVYFQVGLFDQVYFNAKKCFLFNDIKDGSKLDKKFKTQQNVKLIYCDRVCFYIMLDLLFNII
jgi:hypothetical protein